MVQQLEHVAEIRAKLFKIQSDADLVQLPGAGHRGYLEVVAVQSLAHAAVTAKGVRGGEVPCCFYFVRHTRLYNKRFIGGAATFRYGH